MGGRDDGTRGERLARLALALLVVGAPLVYLVRGCTAAPTPRPLSPPPAQVHLVVLTVDRWAQPEALPAHPAFEELARRGVTSGPLFAASDDPFAAAASLWTGRHAAHHGVRGPGLGLRPGDWTLASAAEGTGALTAAYLAAPLASAPRLGGFAEVVEAPALGAERLAAEAAAFLAREPGRRKLLWLHLRDPGERGAAAGEVLDAVLRALDATDQRPDALVLFTALSGPRQAEAELALRVPLVAQLPAALNAGRAGEVSLSQVDLAGGLAELMRLPGPDLDAGQARLQSRPEAVTAALQGQESFEWVWCEGEFGEVLRRRGLRVRARSPAEGAPREHEASILVRPEQPPSALEPFAPADVAAAVETFEQVRRGVVSGARAAVPSALPPGWR